MLRSSRVLRAAAQAEWKKSVGPFTLPSIKSAFSAMESEIHQKQAVAKQAPKEAPAAIDFDAFRAKISKPGVVDAMEADYKAKVAAFGGPTDPSQAIADSKAGMTKLMGLMDKYSTLADGQLDALKQELAHAKANRNTVTDWSLDDFYKEMPGLEAELLEEFENNKYWPSEAEERVAALDFAAQSEQLSKGTIATANEADLPNTLAGVDTAEFMADSEAMVQQIKDDLRAVVDDVPAFEARVLSLEKEFENEHPSASN